MKRAGVNGVLAGEGSYEDAKSDLEFMTVMSRSQTAPDGRRFADIQAEVFEKQIVERGRVRGPDPMKYLRKRLRGPEFMQWYAKDAKGSPHSPFRFSPKQERWMAKLKTLVPRGKDPRVSKSEKRRKK